MENKNHSRSALEMAGYKTIDRNVSDRIKNITVSAIKEMGLLASTYEDAVYLAQGTPDFLTPEHVREKIKQELDENPSIGKYGMPFNGITPLRKKIAQTLMRKRGIKADYNTEIYVTVGAMEATATSVLTVVNPGDEVMLLSPCFPSHIVQITLAEGVPVYVPLNKEKNWSLNIEDVQAKITVKTKAMIICNPANPTGSVFGKTEMEGIARLAKEHDFWVITDEPYDFLVYDNHEFFSISQIPEIRDRLICCFSLSKEYAMTGFRIGYVFAQQGIINHMIKIHDSILVTAATISQIGALEALSGDQAEVNYFKSEFEKRRDLICKRLDKLPNMFEYQKPQGSYYIFPKIKGVDDDYAFSMQLLKDTHVVVVPGSAFGPEGMGHVRMCYAGSEDDINKAFDRIEKWNRKNPLLMREL